MVISTNNSSNLTISTSNTYATNLTNFSIQNSLFLKMVPDPIREIPNRKKIGKVFSQKPRGGLVT